MCLDSLPNSRRNQSGFLMPLALFIVVIMGLIALVLMRTTQQTGVAATQEAVSVQAFYAAESGAQQGMQVLFYASGITRQTVDSRCGTNTFNYSVNGLKNCSAVVTCTCRYRDNTACNSGTAANYQASTSVPESYYTLVSAATCGSGPLRATRTIQVGSFLNQE